MAEGFQVPLCECGHTTGAHKSGGRGLVRMGRGVCLMPDCDCREFREKFVQEVDIHVDPESGRWKQDA